MIGNLNKLRVVVRPRSKPIATYTYIITKSDDPEFGETSAEYFFSPSAASEAGKAALLERIVRRKKT
jgi:hypothetical protein